MTRFRLNLVSIYIAETAYFTESDSYGNFKIEVPESDRLVLKCNRLGYQVKEIVLKWKDLESNIQLTIYLQKIINKEVEIRDRRTDQSINIKEKASSFELLPTVSGNLESVLPSIALGVRSSAGGELSSQYSVRGGSYDENLVL